MGRRARACGGSFEGRVELRHTTAQLHEGGLVVEAIVGVGGVRLFGRWGHARVAGAAGGGGGLGAEDGGGTVGLAEVCERDREVHVLSGRRGL